MEQPGSHSEQVIESYKRHKLAVSAFHRIREIIDSFEHDRRIDARLARIGIALLAALIGVALFFFFSRQGMILA